MKGNIRMGKEKDKEHTLSLTVKKYTGSFKNGTMHGQGVLTSSSGNSYEGKWENGKYLNINSYEIDENTTEENVNSVKQNLLDTMD